MTATKMRSPPPRSYVLAVWALFVLGICSLAISCQDEPALWLRILPPAYILLLLSGLIAILIDIYHDIYRP